jgi:hypothetical protein
MLPQILPTTGPGTLDQWGFVGSSTSWAAVVRGSGDTSYIEAAVAPVSSDFFCGSATKQIPGRVVGITLHYRMQASIAAGASVLFSIFQNGTEYVVSPAVPVGVGWVNGTFRVREGWATPGVRPSVQDIYNLGVGIRLLAGPALGTVQVSELWVEVETVDTVYCYDPMNGATPDAIVGPLQWPTIGTQPASITVDKYLEIVDSDPVDFRAYYVNLPVPIRDVYTTEIEARFWVQTAVLGEILLADIFGFVVGVEAIQVPILRTADGHDWIGVVHFDIADKAAYLGSAQIDVSGIDTHIRIMIDRDPDPSTAGQVSVYLNYGSTPIIQVPYSEFIVSAPTIPGFVFFGAFPDTQSVLRYDYVAYKIYKKRPGMFKDWNDFDQGPNSVLASGSDPDVVQPIMIQPPGIWAGQSHYCCVLDVQDSSYPCGVVQAIQLPSALPTTYGVGIDYKVDSPVPQTADLVIQRESDMWYWDQGTVSWVPGYTAFTLPFNPGRTRLPLATGLGLVSPEAVLISVQGTLAPALPHQILIYKVNLYEE